MDERTRVKGGIEEREFSNICSRKEWVMLTMTFFRALTLLSLMMAFCIFTLISFSILNFFSTQKYYQQDRPKGSPKSAFHGCCCCSSHELLTNQ